MKDVLLKVIRKDILYVLLIVVLVVLSVFDVSTLRYGFFTAYDEAYFLLKLQEAYDMSCITGKSQWNLIAVHWFPYLDLTSKVNSYLASCILTWFTIIVMTVTCCVIYDKKRVIRYFALIFLLYFPFCRIAMSYIPMHTAVTSFALCSFMIFHHCKKIGWKVAFAALLGINLCLDGFIYIPAALALTGALFVTLVVMYWKDKKKLIIYLLSMLGGALVALGYINFCICGLGDIIESMKFTAGYIGKSGYSYDISSYVVQYGLFFRDSVFVIIAIAGSYYLSKVIKNKYIGAAVYVLLLLVYTHYQADPTVTLTMFYVSIVIIPLLSYVEKKSILQAGRMPKVVLCLMLLAFPLLASFGTNTDLGNRIATFTISWLFILFYYWESNKVAKQGRVVLGLVVLALIPLKDVVTNYQNRDDSYHFTRGNKYFAELAITEKQKNYFDNVYDILEEYNYEPNKSVVFTAVFDYCCLYAFDAVNSSNFHQIKNFHFFDKDKMLKPDFIFLCKWDSITIAEELHNLPWGWPEDFDEYYVGTPEPEDAPWVLSPELERRKLYCRKSLKQKELE